MTTLSFHTRSGQGFSTASVTAVRGIDRTVLDSADYETLDITPLVPSTDADICPVCGTFAGCQGEEEHCPRDEE